jgi:hypothetical protein
MGTERRQGVAESSLVPAFAGGIRPLSALWTLVLYFPLRDVGDGIARDAKAGPRGTLHWNVAIKTPCAPTEQVGAPLEGTAATCAGLRDALRIRRLPEDPPGTGQRHR